MSVNEPTIRLVFYSALAYYSVLLFTGNNAMIEDAFRSVVVIGLLLLFIRRS